MHKTFRYRNDRSVWVCFQLQATKIRRSNLNNTQIGTFATVRYLIYSLMVNGKNTVDCAVRGILGPRVVRLILLPNLELYLRLLNPELSPETQRYEAWRVYEALQLLSGSKAYGGGSEH